MGEHVELRRRSTQPPAMVTLIRPPNLVLGMTISTVVCPPIGMACVAGALEAAGHRVRVIDAVGEDLDRLTPFRDARFRLQGLTVGEIVDRIDPGTEVIGLACSFSHDWPAYREVIEAVRARFPHSLLVAGGEAVTAAPEECLDDCPSLDAIVLGEGEPAMAELVDQRKRRDRWVQITGLVLAATDDEGHRRTEGRARSRDATKFGTPAWHLVPLERYLDAGVGLGVDRGRSLPVLATRGCPYRCTFCSSPSMWTTRYVTREPADVLDEIRRGIERYGIDNVDFYDLTMIIRRSWIIELCQLVIDSGLQFTWQLPSGTRTEAMDAEVCAFLHRAGCRNLTYAPESGSRRTLERIKKKVDPDRMVKAIRDATGVGLLCTANTIIGFPGETRRDMAATLVLIVRMALAGLDTCTIAPFSPYPGSALFDELRAQGKIGRLDDDYYLALSCSTIGLADSWTEHVGARELQVYRLGAMAVFYAVAYARRPSRLVHLARVVRGGGEQDTRLEQAMRDYWMRSRGKGRTFRTG